MYSNYSVHQEPYDLSSEFDRILFDGLFQASEPISAPRSQQFRPSRIIQSAEAFRIVRKVFGKLFIRIQVPQYLKNLIPTVCFSKRQDAFILDLRIDQT